MGRALSKAAFEVLRSAPPVGKRRQKAPIGCLSTVERLALVFLADAARDETGLAWPSQQKIAGFVGCCENTIGPAIAALVHAGHLSVMPKRNGTFALYLVHPGGKRLEPLPSQAVIRRHLSRGRFANSEQDRAIEWLTQQMPNANKISPSEIVWATARTLRSKDKAPPTVGGVSAKAGSSIPPNDCEKPPQSQVEGPPTIGAEPLNEPKIEPSTLQRMSSRSDTHKEKVERFDWWGEPGDVLERRLAVGDGLATRLAAMSQAEAIDQIRKTQRLTVWPLSKSTALACEAVVKETP